MNTSCNWWLEDDDGGRACGEDTIRGREHCEVHRMQRLRDLDRKKQHAKTVLAAAEADYFAYLGQGYDP